METIVASPLIARLVFDEEDRLPQEYFDVIKQEQEKEKAKAFKKINPNEWLKAKEFVPTTPRSLKKAFLAEAFTQHQDAVDASQPSFQEFVPYLTNYDPNMYCYPSPCQQEVIPDFPYYPNQNNLPQHLYKNTFSSTSSQSTGSGSSFKKRKRQRTRKSNKGILGPKENYQNAQTAFDNICSNKSLLTSKLFFSSVPDLNKIKNDGIKLLLKNSNQLLCKSCPSLSGKDIQLWEVVLKNIQSLHNQTSSNDSEGKKALKSAFEGDAREAKQEYEKENNVNLIASRPYHPMLSSTFETLDALTLQSMDDAVHSTGISSSKVRNLERQLNGLKLENSFNEHTMVKRVNDLPIQHQLLETNPAYGQKSLQTELEEIDDLKFKPLMTHHGFTQLDKTNYLVGKHNFMSTYDVIGGGVGTATIDPSKYYNKYNYETNCIDGWDSSEGIFGDVDYQNAFKHSSTNPTSLWSRMQWLFKQKRSNIRRIIPSADESNNVCCIIM